MPYNASAMPIREDERALRRPGDASYCVVCRQYLAPEDWAVHEHNPARRQPIAGRPAPRPALLAASLRVGPCLLENTSGVLVLEGLEVFRLRHRGDDGHIAIDLDLRGPAGVPLAKIARNQPLRVAPGYAWHDNGGILRLTRDAGGAELARIAAAGPRGVALTGEFWAGAVCLRATADALTLDGSPLPTTPLYGPGTAILLRKGKGIAFAKR